MNPYLKNLNKIEFVVTYACTGRCKHCSEGDHTSCGEWIDPQIAADAVRKIAAEYFTDELSKNPYEEGPHNVRCLSFEPNGDVLDENIYCQDIMDLKKILRR